MHSAGAGGIIVAFIDSFQGLDGQLLLSAGLVVDRHPAVRLPQPGAVVLPAGQRRGVRARRGVLVIYELAKNGIITLNGQSQGILYVLVIGAGTDYALLLISRYREELHEYDSPIDAMIAAWKGVAPPIIASAVTVILGLICLTFAELNSTAGLGPVCAIGIGCTALVMLTVLPALLRRRSGTAGSSGRSARGVDHQTDILDVHGMWGRFSKTLAAHYRRSWVGAGVLLIAVRHRRSSA